MHKHPQSIYESNSWGWTHHCSNYHDLHNSPEEYYYPRHARFRNSGRRLKGDQEGKKVRARFHLTNIVLRTDLHDSSLTPSSIFFLHAEFFPNDLEPGFVANWRFLFGTAPTFRARTFETIFKSSGFPIPCTLFGSPAIPDWYSRCWICLAGVGGFDCLNWA